MLFNSYSPESYTEITNPLPVTEKGGWKITTIYDIALRVGVSAATVSRVINGHTDVSKKTRLAVERIMEELDYHPNAAARGLATKRSFLIGVIYQDHIRSGIRHPFFQDLLARIQEVAGAKGYDLILHADVGLDVTASGWISRIKRRGTDGFIIFGLTGSDAKLVEMLNSSIPCMCIDLDVYGRSMGYVATDNRRGAEMAVDHLVDMGHEDIAFIADIYCSKPGLDRLRGFQKGLAKHGLPLKTEWVVNADFSEEGGYSAAIRLLQQVRRPSAIFCASDSMALGAISALTEYGLHVGVNISLVGFDDIAILKYVQPGITTIRQKRSEMGEQAANALLKMIEDPASTPSIVIVEPQLVIRNSVVRIRQ